MGSNAGDQFGKGVPRKAFHIFDVKSEIDLRKHQIKFLSCQDLLNYYKKPTGINEEWKLDEVNVYELVKFFIKRNPNGFYFLDEIPWIKGNSIDSQKIFSTHSYISEIYSTN